MDRNTISTWMKQQPNAAQGEPVAYSINRDRKVYGVDLLESFGAFYTSAKATADEYRAKGWTVTPLYTSPPSLQVRTEAMDAARYRFVRDQPSGAAWATAYDALGEAREPSEIDGIIDAAIQAEVSATPEQQK